MSEVGNAPASSATSTGEPRMMAKGGRSLGLMDSILSTKVNLLVMARRQSSCAAKAGRNWSNSHSAPRPAIHKGLRIDANERHRWCTYKARCKLLGDEAE